MARIPQDLIYELAEQVNCPLDALRESRAIALMLAERVLGADKQYNEIVRAHASVLADNDRLMESIEVLRVALHQALDQWRMYAEQDPDFDSTTDPTAEAREYRKCYAVLTENKAKPMDAPKKQEMSRCKCGELLRFSPVTGLWSCGACMTEITVAHVNQEGQ